jgi:hypothetical protein
MTESGRRNVMGYDVPYHRDWLFVSALILSVMGGVIRLLRGDVWWEALASIAGGVLIIGLVLGSLRELLRGFHEP